MSASQLRLLTLFVDRAGELVTRDELAARLWTDTRTIDVSTGINTAINRLRRNLQEAPGAPPTIETVVGLGYRFIATVETAIPAPAAEEKLVQTAPEPIADQAVAPVQGESLERSLSSREPSLEQQELLIRLPSTPERVGPPGTRRAWIAISSLGIFLALLLFAVLLLRHGRGAHAKIIEVATPAAQPPLTRITAEEEVGKLTAAAMAPSGDSVAYADRFGVSVHWFATGAERLLGVRPEFNVDRLSWLTGGNGLLMSGLDSSVGRRQVWFVPQQGAYLSLLLENASRAAVSPEGGQIAFTRNQDRELWTADTEGQHQRPIRKANAGEKFSLLIWNAAGNRLIVTLRKDRDPSAAAAVPLQNAAANGAYECIDAASGQVLAREEGFSADSGYLLADGRFYYLANETPGPTTGKSLLMVVSTDLVTGHFKGTPELVRNLGARHAQSLTASSGGARFAAILDKSETDVHVADLRPPYSELSDVKRLTKGARQSFPHSWTADGKGVIFESDLMKEGLDTVWAIFSQSLNEAKPNLIARLPESAAMAQLSPDGQWILFLEFMGRPQHASGIFRVPATGGRIEQVTTSGQIEEFHCSTSTAGRCVVREAIGNEYLVYYALDPVQGMGQELGRVEWQPNRLGDWGLSADGSSVAAATHDAEKPTIQLIRFGSTPTQVHAIAVPGHGTTLGANWAIDGRTLFVECKTKEGFELLSMDLAGQIRLLRSSPSLIWAVPSRDGQKVAFPSLSLSESVWSSIPQ